MSMSIYFLFSIHCDSKDNVHVQCMYSLVQITSDIHISPCLIMLTPTHPQIRKQWGQRYHEWLVKAEKKMEELQQVNTLL